MMARQKGKQSDTHRPPALKAAERMTMVISALLVLATAGYLAWRATREQVEAVPVRLVAHVQESRAVEGGYVLPVEVENRGDRTIHQFRGEVSWKDEAGNDQQRDIEVDYIGEHASQRVYLIVQHDPHALKLTLTPHSYLLD